ncbi:MAG TPA: shikimate dehydrogenase [candidate division Zixibacteria bacterium]|nr:shikimate dehydrogenase [candidate division Zixibacteria bacterium]
MITSDQLAAIQDCVTNRLDPERLRARWLCAVIGDGPSTYSRSPALWNAAFRALGLDATYVALDVRRERLGDFFAALRACGGFLGVNVTVPYKIEALAYLDEIDPGAQRIGAVNTIVRDPASGRLVGFNTDGAGFVESILTPQPGRTRPFVESLDGARILLIGAGGSARALAFHLSDRLGEGELVIANRTESQARALAGDIRGTGRRARAIDESGIADFAPHADLIVNATTKGQSGLRKLPDGRLVDLEPYSALAPARPVPCTEAEWANPELREAWRAAARADIEANHRASRAVAGSVPPGTGFCDIIYHPEETVFLRHGRETGHRTMNGKAMIVCQAAIALRDHVCKRELAALSKADPASYRRILETMYAAW